MEEAALDEAWRSPERIESAVIGRSLARVSFPFLDTGDLYLSLDHRKATFGTLYIC